jgi:hypothetical protein
LLHVVESIQTVLFLQHLTTEALLQCFQPFILTDRFPFRNHGQPGGFDLLLARRQISKEILR